MAFSGMINVKTGQLTLGVNLSVISTLLCGIRIIFRGNFFVMQQNAKWENRILFVNSFFMLLDCCACTQKRMSRPKIR
jgi:uncharacterized membrane protein SirB2